MLVLTIKDGSTLIVGDAKITIERKGRDSKVLIDAPKHMEVSRDRCQKKHKTIHSN
jgi:sRNA-binding carbon storage regulator CsrA